MSHAPSDAVSAHFSSSARYAPLNASTPAAATPTFAGLCSDASIFWQPHEAVTPSALSVHIAMLHSANGAVGHTTAVPE